MFKCVEKVVRVKKYHHFGKVLSEFYGGTDWGMKKDGIVWVKIGGKRVYFDVFFHHRFGNRIWGGDKFLVYEMKFIRVVRIGKVDLKYSLVVDGICLPKNGYVHEDSELYQFLQDMRGFVRRYGINQNKL